MACLIQFSSSPSAAEIWLDILLLEKYPSFWVRCDSRNLPFLLSHACSQPPGRGNLSLNRLIALVVPCRTRHVSACRRLLDERPTLSGSALSGSLGYHPWPCTPASAPTLRSLQRSQRQAPASAAQSILPLLSAVAVGTSGGSLLLLSLRHDACGGRNQRRIAYSPLSHR